MASACAGSVACERVSGMCDLGQRARAKGLDAQWAFEVISRIRSSYKTSYERKKPPFSHC